jgi:hypothetical protein
MRIKITNRAFTPCLLSVPILVMDANPVYPVFGIVGTWIRERGLLHHADVALLGNFLLLFGEETDVI